MAASSHPATGACIDHLVVAAASLAEGVSWCEHVLGITPEAGGAHALFGTHNRLLRLSHATHVRSYLEVIAIDPAVTPARAAPLMRWFDLDHPRIAQKLQAEGPQLLHWVASVPDLNAACAAWRALGIDPGPVIEASRPTPRGMLRWRITVRDDGQRLFGGALPTLIEWGDEHPSDHMAGEPLALQSFTLRHPEASTLRHALDAIGLDNVSVQSGPCGLTTELCRADHPSVSLIYQDPA